MFDEIERQKELKRLYASASNEVTFNDFLLKIAMQEKLIIEQAKKEAREEFSEKLKLFGFWKDDCNTVIIYTTDINNLLKEYEV